MMSRTRIAATAVLILAAATSPARPAAVPPAPPADRDQRASAVGPWVYDVLAWLQVWAELLNCSTPYQQNNPSAAMAAIASDYMACGFGELSKAERQKGLNAIAALQALLSAPDPSAGLTQSEISAFLAVLAAMKADLEG